MPDQQGKPSDGPLGGSSADDGAATAPTEGKPDESYLGTFADKEAAEAGWQSAQETIQRLTSEKDKALSAGTKTQQELLEKLGQIATTQAAPQQAPAPLMSEKDFEAWDNGDGKHQLGVIMDLQRRIVEETAGKDDLVALKQEIADAKNALASQLAEVDPAYLKHKDTVTELKDKFPGADRATLVAFAEIVDANKPPSNEPRQDLPGSTATTVVTDAGQDNTIAANDLAIMESVLGKMSDEDKAVARGERK